MAFFIGTKNDDILPAAGDDNSGDDIISGLGGADTITGGAGMDLMYGGTGADTFIINNASEIVANELYSGGDGVDTLKIMISGDLTVARIDPDVEVLATYASGFTTLLTTAQFRQFQTVSSVGILRLSGGGTVNMTGRSVSAPRIELQDATTLNLTGQTGGGIDIEGSSGNDVITGGDANGYFLAGQGGADTLTGGAAADMLEGGAGKDILKGGAGDDTFLVEYQSDLAAGESYAGGSGIDTIKFDKTASGETRFNLTSVSIGADIEVLSADAGIGISLSAAQLGNFQSLMTNDITLTGAGTADLTDATLPVSGATFRLSAAGNTLILTGINTTGFFASCDVEGGGQADTVYGSDGIDRIGGNGGNDSLHGGEGADTIYGGTGKDVLDGGGGNDLLILSGPNEILTGESYAGGAGVDTLGLYAAADGTTPYTYNLTGTTIASDVEGLSVLIDAFGGAGGNVNIILTPTQLAQFTRIDARADRDTLTLSAAGTANLAGAILAPNLKFNLSAAGNTLSLAGTTSNNSDFDTAFTVNGGNGNDVITGGDGIYGDYFGDGLTGDTLNGGGGTDTINGGAGNDTITGGAGKDTLNGGSGNDLFVLKSQSEIVAGESYAGGSGVDTLSLSVGASNISSLTISTDVEVLRGTDRGVSLTAAQLDAFKSIVSVPTATLTNAGSASLAGVTIDPNVSFSLAAAGNTLNLTGVVSSQPGTALTLTVNGNAGNDVITGSDNIGGLAVDDTLNGGGGNDTINGGAGNDFIYGGAGKDTMYGGANDDTLIIKTATDVQAGEIYNGGNGNDTLDIQTTATMNLSTATISLIETLHSLGRVSLTASQLGAFSTVDTGDVTLTNAGVADLTNATVDTDNFVLSSAGNTLNLTGVSTQGYKVTGGAGVDRIYGGDRADSIIGGAGNDSLQGGEGADTFDYRAYSNAGVDHILDFSGMTPFGGTPGDGDGDKIGLAGQAEDFSYIGAAAFDGTTQMQARFGGNGVVQVDVNGDRRSDLSFVLNGMTQANQLTAGDFAFS